MPNFSVKSVKTYAIVEQVIESPVDLEELRAHLKANKFLGELHANSNQGGVTTVVLRERIPVSMQELDEILKRR